MFFPFYCVHTQTSFAHKIHRHTASYDIAHPPLWRWTPYLHHSYNRFLCGLLHRRKPNWNCKVFEWTLRNVSENWWNVGDFGAFVATNACLHSSLCVGAIAETKFNQSNAECEYIMSFEHLWWRFYSQNKKQKSTASWWTRMGMWYICDSYIIFVQISMVKGRTPHSYCKCIANGDTCEPEQYS